MGTRNALFVVGVCGTAGVLVDIDHLIAFLNGWEAKFLHTPLLIVSCVMLVGLSTYLGRQLLR